MKYPAHIYAKALAEAIASGRHHDEIKKNFIQLLRKSGDEVHLQKILEEAERFLREKDGTKKIVVHLARPQKAPVRDLVKHLVGPHDAVEEDIDPSLIAGMKVTVNDERSFDGSLASKLERMFGK